MRRWLADEDEMRAGDRYRLTERLAENRATPRRAARVRVALAVERPASARPHVRKTATRADLRDDEPAQRDDRASRVHSEAQQGKVKPTHRDLTRVKQSGKDKRAMNASEEREQHQTERRDNTERTNAKLTTDSETDETATARRKSKRQRDAGEASEQRAQRSSKPPNARGRNDGPQKNTRRRTSAEPKATATPRGTGSAARPAAADPRRRHAPRGFLRSPILVRRNV